MKTGTKLFYKCNPFFKGIEFIDVNGAEKGFKNGTFPQFKKYTLFKQIKDFGLHNYIKLFKKEVRSGSNVTKYRNEIFSLFRSQVVEDIDLREELLFEFEKKINGLLYNKINSYSNSNNTLIEE